MVATPPHRPSIQTVSIGTAALRTELPFSDLLICGLRTLFGQTGDNLVPEPILNATGSSNPDDVM